MWTEQGHIAQYTLRFVQHLLDCMKTLGYIYTSDWPPTTCACPYLPRHWLYAFERQLTFSVRFIEELIFSRYTIIVLNLTGQKP